MHLVPPDVRGGTHGDDRSFIDASSSLAGREEERRELALIQILRPFAPIRVIITRALRVETA